MKKVFVFIALAAVLSSCGVQSYVSNKFTFNQSKNDVTGNSVFTIEGDSLYETDKLKEVTPVAEQHFWISEAKFQLTVETNDSNFDWKKYMLEIYGKLKKAVKKGK